MNRLFGHRIAAAAVMVCLGAEHQGLWPEPAGRWIALIAGAIGLFFVNVRGGAPGSKS